MFYLFETCDPIVHAYRYRTDGLHVNLDVAEYDETQEKADDPFETDSLNSRQKDTYSLPEIQLDRTSYLSFE